MKKLKYLFPFLILLLFASPGWGTIYYIDQSCTTGGTGTSQTCDAADGPFKTIAAAQAAVTGDQHGNSLLIKKETPAPVYREQFTVGANGTAAGQFTVGAYGSGDKPIISGSDIVTSFTLNSPGEVGGIFTSGFEFDTDAFAADFTSKTTNGTNTLTISSSAGTFNNGAKGAKATFDGTNKKAYVTKTIADQTNLYVRLYFKLNSAFAIGTNYNAIDLFSIYDGATLVAGVTVQRVDPGFRFYVPYYQPSSSYVYGGGPTTEISVNVWHYVELRFYSHASTGGFEFWFNGVSKGSIYTLDTSAITIDTVNVGPADLASAGIASIASEVYFDDVKFSTSEIGAYSETPSNVYHAAVSSTVFGVFQDDNWMEPKTNESAVDSTVNSWFWVNNVLYIRASDSSDPASSGKVYEAAIRNYSIVINGKSYITIDNLDLRNAAVDGLRIYGASNYVYSTNCIFQYNVQRGIYVREWFDTANVLDHLLFQDFVSHHNGYDGLRAENRTTNITIRRGTAYQNVWFHDAVDPFKAGIRVVNHAYEGDAQTSTSALIENCISYNNGKDDAGSVRPNIAQYEGTGLWFDTVGTGSIMRYNKSYNNAGYVGLHLEATNGAKVYYNLVYNNDQEGILVDTTLASWISQNNEVYNNVSYGNLHSGINVAGKPYYTDAETSVNNIFKNNISVDNTGHLFGGANLKAGAGGENAHTTDGWGSGNVYLYNSFGVEAADFIRWGWGTAIATYAAFDAAYGSATNSVTSDPLFVSISDFHLQAGSPAINAGVDVGLVLDYEGNPVPMTGGKTITR